MATMRVCKEVLLPLIVIGIVWFYMQNVVACILKRSEGNLLSRWSYHLYPQAEEAKVDSQNSWFEYFGFTDPIRQEHYSSIECISRPW